MTFKPKQLVMKVRHPLSNKGEVPVRSVGEYIRFDPLHDARKHVHLCFWPGMKGKTTGGSNGSGRWWMQDGTIIPLNDPDFKGEDTDADVHSRRREYDQIK